MLSYRFNRSSARFFCCRRHRLSRFRSFRCSLLCKNSACRMISGQSIESDLCIFSVNNALPSLRSFSILSTQTSSFSIKVGHRHEFPIVAMPSVCCPTCSTFSSRYPLDSCYCCLWIKRRVPVSRWGGWQFALR